MRLRSRFVTLTLLSSFLVPHAGWADNQSMAAASLLQAFGGSCRSTAGGAWTRTALNHTGALISTLSALKEAQQAACKGVSGAMSSVQNLQWQIGRIMSDPLVNDYRANQEKRNDLVTLISQLTGSGGSNPDQISYLQQALWETEVKLAEGRAQSSVVHSESEKNRLTQGMTSITQFAQQLRDEKPNLTECYAAAPYMAWEMAGSLLSIGGSFATPIFGAAFTAVGQMISTAVNFILNAKIDARKLEAEGINMQSAVACGLEAMTNLWCDADASNRFFALAREAEGTTPGEPGTVWEGMDLMGRRLPVLNTWLLQVLGGVEPSDPDIGRRKARVWGKVQDMRSFRYAVQGLFNRTRDLMTGASPEQIKTYTYSAATTSIETMFPNISSEGVNAFGPIAEYRPSVKDVICFLAQGPGGCSGGPHSDQWKTYLSGLTFLDGFEGWRTRTYELLDDIDQLVLRELNREINVDPDKIVTQAGQKLIDNLSPIEVMESLAAFFRRSADYFERHHGSPTDPMKIKLLVDTALKLEQVRDAILGLPVPQPSPTPSILAGPPILLPIPESEGRIAYVFEKLNLKDGTQVITDRISQLIRWDMEAKIRNGELPKDVTKDLIASGQNIIDVLAKSGINTADLTGLELDTAGGQSASNQNLWNFMKTYEGTIDGVMRKLKKVADDGKETWQGEKRPNLIRLAQLCVLVLSVGKDKQVWPSGISAETCKGAFLTAGKKSGIELRFDVLKNTLAHKPFSERVCTYYNFMRESRVYRAKNGIHPQDALDGEDFGVAPGAGSGPYGESEASRAWQPFSFLGPATGY